MNKAFFNSLLGGYLRLAAGAADYTADETNLGEYTFKISLSTKTDGKANIMAGGDGDDTYVVDNVADRVIESSTGGKLDWVATSVSYTLAAGVFVEKLSTTISDGTTAINLTGNEIGQVIGGNAGANIINGKAGNDTLIVGGGGADVFLFDTSLDATTNVDTITDFNVPADMIWLDNGIFAQLAGTGGLYASQFVKNTTGLAEDGSDRIIYDSDTGKLFYDANGSNFGGAVQFATLAPNLALTGWDFHIA